MSCLYCDAPEIRERQIGENEFARAFPTNIPITLGHTLVVPKRHVAKLAELSQEELVGVFELAKQIELALARAFGAEGFNSAFNQGAVAGQSIPHFHLHIVPRTAGDAGITKYEPREFLYRPGSRETTPESELQAVAAAIRRGMLSA